MRLAATFGFDTNYYMPCAFGGCGLLGVRPFSHEHLSLDWDVLVLVPIGEP
jgi:hypothetical protein